MIDSQKALLWGAIVLIGISLTLILGGYFFSSSASAGISALLLSILQAKKREQETNEQTDKKAREDAAAVIREASISEDALKQRIDEDEAKARIFHNKQSPEEIKKRLMNGL